MPQVPFSVTTDYMHVTAEGCVRVVAVPHITIYRIPHDFSTASWIRIRGESK